jgi:soluble lytic murein transglycosylase-like protein
MRVRWLFALALCVVPVAQAQIYGGRDPSGAIVLSNFRSAVTDEVLVAAPEPLQPVPALAPRLMPDNRLASLISQAALDNALSPQLLHAVIAVESDFDARAVSRKGALGLMQLMPQTARQFGVRDPFDPAQNINAGAAHLKSLLDRFRGDVELALAAYNAGEAAVVKAGYRIPPFAETQAYVPRVLARSGVPTPDKSPAP